MILGYCKLNNNKNYVRKLQLLQSLSNTINLKISISIAFIRIHNRSHGSSITTQQRSHTHNFAIVIVSITAIVTRLRLL